MAPPYQALPAPVMVTGANPAANAEVDDTVPEGEVWEVLAVILTFVADANAANRTVRLAFQDENDAEIYGVANGTAITATQTVGIEAAPLGAAPSNITGTQYVIIPQNFWLGPGCQIKTVTTNLQATDNFGATRYWVRKWSPS